MHTLYVKTGCPYCAMVLKKIDDLGIIVEEKNIADEGVVEEIIERGGKKQEPFLYDEEKGIALYESSNIVDFLEKEYGKKEDMDAHVHLHRTNEPHVCEACE